MFTSRSEILCGALEECLASCLIHWPHSGPGMMSHTKHIHTGRHKSRQAAAFVQLKSSNSRCRSIKGYHEKNQHFFSQGISTCVFFRSHKLVALETYVPLQRFQGPWPKQAWDALDPNLSPVPSCHMDTKTFLQESDPVIGCSGAIAHMVSLVVRQITVLLMKKKSA